MADTLRPLPPPHERWRRPIHAFGWIVFAGTSIVLAAYFTSPTPDWAAMMYTAATSTPPQPQAPVNRIVRHVPMPKEVRGVYMSAPTAASAAMRANIFSYLKRNHLNAVVIDLKDSDGRLAFKPERASLKATAPETATIKNIDAVLEEAGAQKLYRIARIFVFQDPAYVARFPGEAIQKKGGGVWADHKGIVWVNAASQAAWAYNAEIAREAYVRGFDEVQFDYIRFPSDGDMTMIRYTPEEEAKPKHEVLRAFFRFMHDELEVKERIPVSYDLFGYVTWYLDYDLGIGQLLVDALPNGTAVSPMVYPSHYGKGTLGYPNPAEHPYEIVADSLMKANKLYTRREKECGELASGIKSATSTFLLPCDGTLAVQRPWIQAFDIGAVYDASMIQAQIKAVRDQHGGGFLLWNARNVYRDFDLDATATSAL